MTALRARLGLTEGQLYTVAILGVIAVLLTSSLTGLHGRFADLVAAEEPPPADPATADVVAAPATTSVTLTVPPFRPARPAAATTVTSATPPITVADPPRRPASPPRFDDDDAPEPEPPVCPADAVIDTSRAVLVALDGVLGGVVPDGTVVSAIALATGCSRADPTVLLLAALIEIGQGLPDLGLDFLELPVLPFLEIPQPVIDLVQPARPALDPICATIGIPVVITSQAGPHFPAPIDAVFAVSLYYALTTCGQLTGS